MAGPFDDDVASAAELSGAPGDHKALTVAQVVDGGAPAATREAARGAARAVAASGGRAVIAALGAAGSGLWITGVETLEVAAEAGFLRRGRAGPALAVRLSEAPPDILHAHGAAAAEAGAEAAAALGARLVATVDAAPGAGAAAALRAERIVAASDHLAALALAAGADAGRVLTIPPGVDMAVFAEEAVPAGRTVRQAEAWGLAEDFRPLILAPTALAPEGGRGTLIAALAALAGARGPDAFTCVIAGEDEAAAAEAEAAILGAGLGGLVRVAPPSADPPAALKLAALVVAADEAPPATAGPVLEALAMGRPVIAPAHGAMAEAVEDGGAGWLTPPGDAGALAAALGRALDLDDSQRAHAGLAGRARVRARYTREAAAAALTALYEDLAGRPFTSPG